MINALLRFWRWLWTSRGPRQDIGDWEYFGGMYAPYSRHGRDGMAWPAVVWIPDLPLWVPVVYDSRDREVWTGTPSGLGCAIRRAAHAARAFGWTP